MERKNDINKTSMEFETLLKNGDFENNVLLNEKILLDNTYFENKINTNVYIKPEKKKMTRNIRRRYKRLEKKRLKELSEYSNAVYKKTWQHKNWILNEKERNITLDPPIYVKRNKKNKYPESHYKKFFALNKEDLMDIKDKCNFT